MSRRHALADRGRGEGGAVLLLVTFSMLFLVSVAAIVLDLGQAVVTGRQMQNATDAAALAGGRQMDKVRLSTGSANPVSADSVSATVHFVATRNGANGALVTCTVIRWDKTPVGPCSDPTHVRNPLAAGVLVTAGASSKTTFARALGVVETRQDRAAAATVQPLIGQHAPLLICAFGHPAPAPAIFLATSGPGVIPVNYVINPAAIGRSYLAHAPHVSDCGLAGSAWKGDAGQGVTMVPGWIDIGTGVQAGPIRSQIAGQRGCGMTTLGCVMALPICSGSNGLSGANGRLLCERFGVFKLAAQTSNSQTFTLMGGAEVTAGIGGTGLAGLNDARVIKLIL